MRRVLAFAALGVLLAIPAASSCSIAYSEFSQAAWDGDRVFTDRGQGIVVVHLGTGLETAWADAWFPVVGAGGGRVVLGGQDGLGADCSGDEWLRVQRTSNGAIEHEADRARFAVWEDGYAWYDGGLHWRTWTGATGAIPDSTLSVQDDYEIVVAVSAGGARVAVGSGDGRELRVFDRATGARLSFALPGIDGGRADGPHGLAFSMDGSWLARAVTSDEGVRVHAVEVSTGAGWTFLLSADGYAWPATDLVWTAGPLLVRYQDKLVSLATGDGALTSFQNPSDRAPGGLASQAGKAVVMWRQADLQSGKALLLLDEAGAPSAWYTATSNLWTPGQNPVTTSSAGHATVVDPPDGGPGTTDGPGRDVPGPGLGVAVLLLAALAARSRLRNP